ncbi:hypothetical protein KC343_g4479 [Hortaea werneckii]|uniref:Uncharacterized protein n=3 Tax=Hortaea werneckii TaxID=91943 RepID=A0A3M7DH62_HORWE|nr:hypothetical protein KC342_g11279 [Hortaea werneckii]OTA34449.1 hypothetical protein BTJ68_04807 [Hortaea werneckii EXF-2000]KAI6847889.1 hypothetical protein KC358_g2090 [Hortaea werneckii]KAI6849477.1 hypothetical protein KC350_g2603 [Hortaea werneckii]KAI6853110.1 hypothetical protein KC338_g9523 [Hortaea werneckii]
MAISHSAIIVCIIVGALAGVGMGWGITHRFWMARRGEDGTASTEAGAAAGHFEQAQYMREVRLRHQDNLAADYGAPVRPYMMSHDEKGFNGGRESAVESWYS